MTAKAGVVGWPIAHSLSPVLHGHWLKQYGIDGRYERIAIEPGTFPQRMEKLRAAGYRGVNVTVPYKEEAFHLADKVSDEAQIAGAANLLVFNQDGTIRADNTDAFGLAKSLSQAIGLGKLHGRKAVVLGAGGAARAAVLALISPLGATPIHILNRNIDRAHSLARHFSRKADSQLFVGTFDDWPKAARDATLLINATSAGMVGADPLALDLEPLPISAAVCDIVYNPLETDLLRRAKARGHITIDGLGMLMHQAAPSFKAFFGHDPEVTKALRDTLVEALGAR